MKSEENTDIDAVSGGGLSGQYHQATAVGNHPSTTTVLDDTYQKSLPPGSAVAILPRTNIYDTSSKSKQCDSFNNINSPQLQQKPIVTDPSIHPTDSLAGLNRASLIESDHSNAVDGLSCEESSTSRESGNGLSDNLSWKKEVWESTDRFLTDSIASGCMLEEEDKNSNNANHFSSHEIGNLIQTLNTIKFEGLDKLLPLTPQMEEDAISAKSDTLCLHRESRVRPEEPFTNTEMVLLRQILRKQGHSTLSGGNIDDETMPLTWDDKGKPIPLTDSEKSPTGRVLRMIEMKLARPSAKLSQDSFSFLISALTCSTPFMFGSIVFLIKGFLFVLICINLIDLTEEDNPLGIPSGVSVPVAIAQFLAMFIAVASQDDLRTALNYFYEGYEEDHLGSAFIGSNYWKWLIAVWFQFLEGALGLATTFLLIVEADDVVGLVLDFTAVEFITLLDNAFFMLARQGFMGPKNRLESEIVLNTQYRIPVARMKAPTRQISTLFGTFAILLIGWIFVYTRQLQGYYTPKSIVVQFDDDLRPELGAYSGVYNLKITSGFDIDRISYKASIGDGFIGYCYQSKFWTFSINGADACNNFLARSSRSLSFDITETGQDQWFATENSDLQRYFPMENFVLELTCDRDIDCGGVGRGACDDHICVCNKGSYGIRCDYLMEDACETIVVDERRDVFSGRRSFASSYNVLRDDGGAIMLVYDHPVYVAESGTSSDALDVMMYIGVRWVLSHSIDALPQLKTYNHTSKGLADYLSSIKFRAYEHLRSLSFFTEPVIFNTPDDGDSPIGIRWFGARESDLANTERLGSVEAIMLCAVCNDADNSCQNGNEFACRDNGVCRCSNGASGSLCQITPLADGHCDTFFNTAPYKYDGGDCCHATCVSTSKGICGAISVGSLSAVLDIGFPHCEDPAVVVSCGGEVCWTPTSGHPFSISPGRTVLITLSANGRIYVAAVPELDIVEVFDQVDSTWIRRGTLHEGKPRSKFGRILALSTLPGQVVNRRYGRIPILMAIGSSGRGKAGVTVVRWEPNDADWRAVGNEIDICDIDPEDCDLVALDVGRNGDEVTVVVVRSDDRVLVYRTILTETSSEEWVITFEANHTNNTDTGGSYNGVSLSGKTDILALTSGNHFGVHYLPPNIQVESPLNLDNITDPESPKHVNVTDEILRWFGESLPVDMIHAIKLSEDGASLLVFGKGEQERDLSFALRFAVDVAGRSSPELTKLLPFQSSLLSKEDIENGMSLVQFSADASFMAVRVTTLDGPRIRLATFNNQLDSQFEETGELLFKNESLANDFKNTNRDFALSYDASVFLQVESQGTEAYGLEPRCLHDSSHYRMSLSLDDNPNAISWSFETYQTLGNLQTRNEVIRKCDRCYFDNNRFGRCIVAEDVCIPKTDEACFRIRFESEVKLQSGLSLAVFRDGLEMIQYEGNGTDSFVRIVYPERAQECVVPALQCNADEVYIVIETNLDQFPEETTWELIGFGIEGNTSLNSFNYENDLLDGLNYTKNSALGAPLIETCAPSNLTFEFTIRDSFGDGLCCDYGKGGYLIFVEGKLIFSLQEERSFYFDQVRFDSNGTILAKMVPVTFEIRQLVGSMPVTLGILLNANNGEESMIEAYRLDGSPQNSYTTDVLYLREGLQYGIFLIAVDELLVNYLWFEGEYSLYWGTNVDPDYLLVRDGNRFNTTSQSVLISEESVFKNDYFDLTAPTAEPSMMFGTSAPGTFAPYLMPGGGAGAVVPVAIPDISTPAPVNSESPIVPLEVTAPVSLFVVPDNEMDIAPDFIAPLTNDYEASSASPRVTVPLLDSAAPAIPNINSSTSTPAAITSDTAN